MGRAVAGGCGLVVGVVVVVGSVVVVVGSVVIGVAVVVVLSVLSCFVVVMPFPFQLVSLFFVVCACLVIVVLGRWFACGVGLGGGRRLTSLIRAEEGGRDVKGRTEGQTTKEGRRGGE